MSPVQEKIIGVGSGFIDFYDLNTCKAEKTKFV